MLPLTLWPMAWHAPSFWSPFEAEEVSVRSRQASSGPDVQPPILSTGQVGGHTLSIPGRTALLVLKLLDINYTFFKFIYSLKSYLKPKASLRATVFIFNLINNFIFLTKR